LSSYFELGQQGHMQGIQMYHAAFTTKSTSIEYRQAMAITYWVYSDRITWYK